MQRDPDVAIGQQTEPEREILIYPNPASEQLLGKVSTRKLDVSSAGYERSVANERNPRTRLSHQRIHVPMPGLLHPGLSEEGGKLLRQCIVLQPWDTPSTGFVCICSSGSCQ